MLWLSSNIFPSFSISLLSLRARHKWLLRRDKITTGGLWSQVVKRNNKDKVKGPDYCPSQENGVRGSQSPSIYTPSVPGSHRQWVWKPFYWTLRRSVIQQHIEILSKKRSLWINLVAKFSLVMGYSEASMGLRLGKLVYMKLSSTYHYETELPKMEHIVGRKDSVLSEGNLWSKLSVGSRD